MSPSVSMFPVGPSIVAVPSAKVPVPPHAWDPSGKIAFLTLAPAPLPVVNAGVVFPVTEPSV